MHRIAIIILALTFATAGVEATYSKESGATATGVVAKPKAVPLFNGKDFEGWTAVLSKEGVELEDVWSVDDGVLVCQGKPS
ncbi:MAG: hypothetical protein AAF961_16500, partial [Planctomycetota bacterium]